MLGLQELLHIGRRGLLRYPGHQDLFNPLNHAQQVMKLQVNQGPRGRQDLPGGAGRQAAVGEVLRAKSLRR